MKMKKLLAMVLCVAMVLSTMAVTVSADEVNIIEITADITLTEDIILAESTQYVIPEGAEVTIDLNNHSITGNLHKSFGAVIENCGTLILKNGTVSSVADNGGSALKNNGVATVESVTLNGAPSANGSWASYAVNNTGMLTVNNSLITGYQGGVASYGDDAVVTLNNTNVDKKATPGFTNHAIYTYNDGKVIVNNTAENYVINRSEDQEAMGGSVINGQVEVNGGIFTGRIENYYGTPVIKGGTFDYTPARFVAKGHEVVENADGTYTVKAPVAYIGTKGYLSLHDALSQAGASGSGDTTIEIVADIDLADVVWVPVFVNGYTGADIVTINGNGHTITNLSAPLFEGGFAGGSGIVIKDLTIADSEIVSENTLGSGAFIEAVDSMAKIELTNCHLRDSSVTGSRTGGLIGWTAGYNNQNDGPVKTYVTIKNCSVTGCAIEGSSVGAINGHAGNNAWTYTTIEDCTITNNTLTSTDDGAWRVGVVVGTANVGEVTINNIAAEYNTISQTDKVFPEGQTDLVGRFVPVGTGKLTIDGVPFTSECKAYPAKIGEVPYADLHEAMVSAKSGETVELLSDVDLNNVEWEPVDFKGTFNGNGFTIKNLKINKPGLSNVGFITSLNGAFENVTFENVDVIGGENTGAVAGRAGGHASLAKDITITGNIKIETTHSGYARAAAIVGGWAYGRYQNITVDGINAETSYIKHTGGGDGRYVAGIVGHADDVSEYTNCTVKNITIAGGWLCGGIAGPGPASTVTSGCLVENVNIAADYSGGMFGWYFGNGTIKDSTVKNVEFTDGATANGAIGGYSIPETVTVSNVVVENVENYGGAQLLGHKVTIGNEVYSTVQEAVDNASAGETITLSSDITVNEPIRFSAPATTFSRRSTPEAVVFDMGGNTVTGQLIIDDGATVIIQNGTIVNTNSEINAIQTSGTTTITNVDVTSARHAIRVEGGKTTINSGSYKINNIANYSLCALNVSDNEITGAPAVVEVNGGTFTGDAGLNEATAAVKVRGSSVVTINGGNFSVGDPNTLSAEREENLIIKGGIFDVDPIAYVAPGSKSFISTLGEWKVVSAADADSKIAIKFVKAEKELNGSVIPEGESVYEIQVVSGDAEDKINRLNSADLKFFFNPTPYNGAAMDYVIEEVPNISITSSPNADEKDRYMFNYDFKDATVTGTGNVITIGRVRFTGYGTFTFEVTSADTNEVHATTKVDSIVDTYVPNAVLGQGTLEIGKDENKILDGENKVPTRKLTITLDFPNAIEDNKAAYQDMKVEITGNINGVNQTVTYDLGEDEYAMAGGSYVIEEDRLVLSEAYTITVSGAGYRTARYTVTMTEDKALRFWNNVMDENQVVELGKDSSIAKVTFLAGDIVKDNNINIYDLSAVVSYFGTQTVENGNILEAKYAKYDLNRDGVIDSKDVAYVLVSWNN